MRRRIARRRKGFTEGLGRGEIAAVRSRLQDLRYELLPLKNVYDQAAYLPEGATVTVMASPSRGMGATIDVAVELAERGFTVIPHLAARLMQDRRELEAILQRLDRHNITGALVVAGDSDEPGEFFDSMAMIEVMEDIGHGIRSLGVAAYPEGHPLISDESLQQALEEKEPYATDMTTQMCFAPDTINKWVLQTRDRGIRLPIYFGIPGIADLGELLRISLRIGVGDSMRFLSKNKSLAGKLIRPGGYAPDALVLGLAPTLASPEARVFGFHVYTFNQVKSTEEWRHDMLQELLGIE